MNRRIGFMFLMAACVKTAEPITDYPCGSTVSGVAGTIATQGYPNVTEYVKCSRRFRISKQEMIVLNVTDIGFYAKYAGQDYCVGSVQIGRREVSCEMNDLFCAVYFNNLKCEKKADKFPDCERYFSPWTKLIFLNESFDRSSRYSWMDWIKKDFNSYARGMKIVFEIVKCPEEAAATTPRIEAAAKQETIKAKTISPAQTKLTQSRRAKVATATAERETVKANTILETSAFDNSQYEQKIAVFAATICGGMVALLCLAVLVIFVKKRNKRKRAATEVKRSDHHANVGQRELVENELYSMTRDLSLGMLNLAWDVQEHRDQSANAVYYTINDNVALNQTQTASPSSAVRISQSRHQDRLADQSADAVYA